MQLPVPASVPSRENASKASAEGTSGTNGAGSSGNASSSTATSSITSNDFLTLLVAEMKNQDPTSNNDPNQYIDQLVQVNSLQQLISINQELAPSSSSTASGSGQSSPAVMPASSPTMAPSVLSKEGIAMRRGVPPGALSAQAQVAASAARVAQALTPPADAAGASSPESASRLQKLSLATGSGLAVRP
jgi:flagellar basal-body rod modification protein FlgD